MGLASLGASDVSENIFLESCNCFTLVALDRDQIPDYFHGVTPAGAGTDGKDVVCSILQADLTPYPPPAVAGVVIISQGQRRTRYLGKFFPIVGASAFVQGIQPRSSVTVSGSHDKRIPNYTIVMTERTKKFRRKYQNINKLSSKYDLIVTFFYMHNKRVQLSVLSCTKTRPGRTFSSIGLFSDHDKIGNRSPVFNLTARFFVPRRAPDDVIQ